MIHIHVDSMKAAELLSAICKDCGPDVSLCSEKFRIDPKSTLGILAMMYSSRDNMFLDTGSMTEEEVNRFLAAIDSYIVREEDKDAV